MKKNLVLLSFTLYLFSCTAMDQPMDPAGSGPADAVDSHAVIDEFMSAVAVADEGHVQAMLERYDIPQELIADAATRALEQGHTHLVRLLRSQRQTSTSELEVIRDKMHMQGHPMDQQLISAIEDNRLEDIQSMLTKHANFDEIFIRLKMLAMLRARKIVIAQLLYDYTKARDPYALEYKEQNVEKFWDVIFEQTIKHCCLTRRGEIEVQETLALCPPSQEILRRCYEYASSAGQVDITSILSMYLRPTDSN